MSTNEQVSSTADDAAHSTRPSTPDRAAAAARIDEHAENLKRHESEILRSARDAVHSGSQRAEDALHRATDATAAAAKNVDARAAAMGERGQEHWAKGRDWVDRSLDEVMDYVRANPGKSLTFAVAGGWLLGSILRRRRH